MGRLLPSAAAVVLLATPLVQAASVFEFGVWMRAVDKRSVSVQKHIAQREPEAASADARELERLYRLMETYFHKDYPAQDAAQISRDGWQLAAGIPAALERQDFDSAAKAAREIALACNDCHDPYKPFR